MRKSQGRVQAGTETGRQQLASPQIYPEIQGRIFSPIKDKTVIQLWMPRDRSGRLCKNQGKCKNRWIMLDKSSARYPGLNGVLQRPTIQALTDLLQIRDITSELHTKMKKDNFEMREGKRQYENKSCQEKQGFIYRMESGNLFSKIINRWLREDSAKNYIGP